MDRFTLRETSFREDRAAGWILLFAQAIERAAVKAGELAQRLAELQALWRERAGHHAITLARRNRAWEARDLFALIDAFERDLATPGDGDQPSRPAPRRKTTRRGDRRPAWA